MGRECCCQGSFRVSPWNEDVEWNEDACLKIRESISSRTSMAHAPSPLRECPDIGIGSTKMEGRTGRNLEIPEVYPVFWTTV
jgi:hypothetical protein